MHRGSDGPGGHQAPASPLLPLRRSAGPPDTPDYCELPNEDGIGALSSETKKKGSKKVRVEFAEDVCSEDGVGGVSSEKKLHVKKLGKKHHVEFEEDIYDAVAIAAFGGVKVGFGETGEPIHAFWMFCVSIVLFVFQLSLIMVLSLDFDLTDRFKNESSNTSSHLVIMMKIMMAAILQLQLFSEILKALRLLIFVMHPSSWVSLNRPDPATMKSKFHWAYKAGFVLPWPLLALTLKLVIDYIVCVESLSIIFASSGAVSVIFNSLAIIWVADIDVLFFQVFCTLVMVDTDSYKDFAFQDLPEDHAWRKCPVMRKWSENRLYMAVFSGASATKLGKLCAYLLMLFMYARQVFILRYALDTDILPVARDVCTAWRFLDLQQTADDEKWTQDGLNKDTSRSMMQELALRADPELGGYCTLKYNRMLMGDMWGIAFEHKDILLVVAGIAFVMFVPQVLVWLMNHISGGWDVHTEHEGTSRDADVDFHELHRKVMVKILAVEAMTKSHHARLEEHHENIEQIDHDNQRVEDVHQMLQEISPKFNGMQSILEKHKEKLHSHQEHHDRHLERFESGKAEFENLVESHLQGLESRFVALEGKVSAAVAEKLFVNVDGRIRDLEAGMESRIRKKVEEILMEQMNSKLTREPKEIKQEQKQPSNAELRDQIHGLQELLQSLSATPDQSARAEPDVPTATILHQETAPASSVTPMCSEAHAMPQAAPLASTVVPTSALIRQDRAAVPSVTHMWSGGGRLPATVQGSAMLLREAPPTRQVAVALVEAAPGTAADHATDPVQAIDAVAEVDELGCSGRTWPYQPEASPSREHPENLWQSMGASMLVSSASVARDPPDKYWDEVVAAFSPLQAASADLSANSLTRATGLVQAVSPNVSAHTLTRAAGPSSVEAVALNTPLKTVRRLSPHAVPAKVLSSGAASTSQTSSVIESPEREVAVPAARRVLPAHTAPAVAAVTNMHPTGGARVVVRKAMETSGSAAAEAPSGPAVTRVVQSSRAHSTPPGYTTQGGRVPSTALPTKQARVLGGGTELEGHTRAISSTQRRGASLGDTYERRSKPQQPQPPQNIVPLRGGWGATSPAAASNASVASGQISSQRQEDLLRVLPPRHLGPQLSTSASRTY